MPFWNTKDSHPWIRSCQYKWGTGQSGMWKNFRIHTVGRLLGCSQDCSATSVTTTEQTAVVSAWHAALWGRGSGGEPSLLVLSHCVPQACSQHCSAPCLSCPHGSHCFSSPQVPASLFSSHPPAAMKIFIAELCTLLGVYLWDKFLELDLQGLFDTFSNE